MTSVNQKGVVLTSVNICGGGVGHGSGCCVDLAIRIGISRAGEEHITFNSQSAGKFDIFCSDIGSGSNSTAVVDCEGSVVTGENGISVIGNFTGIRCSFTAKTSVAAENSPSSKCDISAAAHDTGKRGPGIDVDGTCKFMVAGNGQRTVSTGINSGIFAISHRGIIITSDLSSTSEGRSIGGSGEVQTCPVCQSNCIPHVDAFECDSGAVNIQSSGKTDNSIDSCRGGDSA